MKLVSWNVNGIRAVLKKGFLDYMEKVDADVICLQETKAHPGDVQHVAWVAGYTPHWYSAVKKGYSGTVIFTRVKPVKVTFGIGMPGHDDEGRVITAEFDDFHLVNVYQPNSQRGLTRLDYRTKEWDPAFLGYLKKLEKKKPVVFCGDLNVAHTEIDLTNPKTNRRNAGFTDEERENFFEGARERLRGHVSRVRKRPRSLHVVEPDDELPRAKHRVARRLLRREREAEEPIEARVDLARSDG
ncbi:MAG: exodeoxyribonuclease III [Opitutus sp.]|nr:exodeoxyribonuclease III [Opitutus sp.]